MSALEDRRQVNIEQDDSAVNYHEKRQNKYDDSGSAQTVLIDWKMRLRASSRSSGTAYWTFFTWALG